MPEMRSLRVEAKRVRTDASSSSMSLLLQVYGMDLEDDTEIAALDEEQICLKDGDLWEEPEIRVKEGLDPVKCAVGRQIEYQRLLDFGVIKEIKKTDGEQWIAEKTAKYISSRWEEVNKGEDVRSRWVLREFATTNSWTEFFSATPSNIEINIMHAITAINKWPVIYCDVSVAFLHTPE